MKTFNLFTLLAFFLFITSCSDSGDDNPNPNPNPEVSDFSTGWYGDDDVSKVPVSTNFGFGNSNLPGSFDIISKFPPIGNQGNYGTCVAWSVAYNTKTALSGIQKNLSQSDLAQPQNQFSPKDMFTAIPDNQKNPKCDGTNFDYALDVMQNRGVATMSTVPYVNLGSCEVSTLDPSWTAEAANYKIKYWRKIEATTESIKQNLVNNIPVILGAKLADNFMNWNSDDVISSHSFFNPGNKHGYHAMVIAGYDDAKGPNGAFRVINSWGDSWGDKGYIWIDYNFLLTEFGINSLGENSLFIAANQDGEVGPPDDNPQPSSGGVDLVPWIFDDYSTYDYSGVYNEREMEFNLYNIGSKAALASDNWNVYYIYFNAYNANDYGVMFYDEFNQSIAAETFECPTANNCIINTTIPAQGDFADVAFGSTSIYRTYYVPEITGEYYLVMIADATDVFGESDEQNNYYYTSIDPVYFDNGYALKSDKGGSEFSAKKSTMPVFDREAVSNHSVKGSKQKNAYTNEEIIDLIKRDHKSGKLADKVHEYQKQNPESKILKKGK